MKLSVISALLILIIPTAWADNNGGLQKGDAPPPPHALDSGYRGTDDARIMTITQAILLMAMAINTYSRIKPGKSTLLSRKPYLTTEPWNLTT